MKKLLILLALALTQLPLAQAQITANFIDLAGLSPNTHYKTFKTEHFEFIFADGYFNFTKIAAEEFEHAHTILAPILKWEPRYKTTILVTDNEDDANGFTLPSLRVGIVLIATPPDAWMSTAYQDNWIKLLVFHEYVHMLNIDPTTGVWEVLRWYFGDAIRINGLWPTWMLEGLAVYYETKTSTLGRGRSPYYEGILRAYVKDHKLDTRSNSGMSLDRVNGTFPNFPGGETPYLFGYHLWQSVSEDRKDVDQVTGEYSLRSSHRFPFLINGNLKNLAQKTWTNYWDEFVKRSETRMGVQIKAVQDQGETDRTQISHSEYSALGGTISPDQKWMAWTETNLHEPRSGLILKNISTGEEKRIDDKVLGVSLSFSPDSQWIFYSSLRRYKTFKFYSDLFAYQVNSGKWVQLTHGLRAKDPSVSFDGKKIAFLQNVGASHTLGQADLSFENGEPVLKNVQSLYTPKEFSILGAPRFLNQSSQEVVVSQQELNTNFSDLVQVNVAQKTASVLFHDGKFNRFPAPTSKGILFTSDRSGIDNVYLLNSSLTSNPQAVTNITTGVQFPFASATGDLYGSMITSGGIEIFKFGSSPVKAPPLVESSSPASIPAATLTGTKLSISENQTHEYSPLGSLAPRQWVPLLLADYSTRRGAFLLGEAVGFDSTGKHEYLAVAGYHTKTRTVDGGLTYSYYGFRPKITLSANAYTYDIADDVFQQFYKRTYETAIQLDYPIRWTFSSLSPRLYGFVDWNRFSNISDNQPAPTSVYEYTTPIIPGAGASLGYSNNVQSSKLGFMPESGFQLYAGTEARFNERIHPLWKYLATATSFHELWEHTVLQPKFRYLGSTVNLATDNASVLLEQGTHTSLDKLGVRGYPNALFRSRIAGIASLDFHFPIHRFYGGAGTTPFFLKQLHGFVFGESAYIPSTRAKNLYFPSVGAGLVMDTQLFIVAPINFVIEVQRGLRKDLGGDTVGTLGITSSYF